MTRGPGPTSHATGVRSLSAEKANRRAQKVNRHPWLCASSSPPKTTVQSMTWGPRPTKSYSFDVGCWVQRERIAARTSTAPPRGRCRRQRRRFFKTNAAVSRHLMRGPVKPSGVGAAGQSAARTDVAVGMTEGGLVVITSTSTRKRRANRQPGFGPTCRLVSSLEVGPGATVSTLKQGYPLLQYKDTVPARLSLAVWRTAPKPTTWTALGPPRGQRRQYPPRYQRWVRTPMGKWRTPAYKDRTSGQGPGPPWVQTGPPGWVLDLSVWGPGHSQHGPRILGQRIPRP
jgi:hypothetical protein